MFDKMSDFFTPPTFSRPSFTFFKNETVKSERSSLAETISEESFCEDTWTIVDEETLGESILPKDTPIGIIPIVA